MAEQKSNIYTKLLQFQKLDILVTRDGENDFFKKNGKPSKYVTLNEVLEKAKKPLNEMGIVIIFAPEAEGLRTTLFDTESETKIEGYMKYVGADNAQKLLACNTYFRRGTLISLLGLEDEDDDGNKASEPVKVVSAKPKPDPYKIAMDKIDATENMEQLNELMTKISTATMLTTEQKEALYAVANEKEDKFIDKLIGK